MEIFSVAVAARLEQSRRILIAGAGGGFDVFAGLPLFHALTKAGKHVSLANLSFTKLGATHAEGLAPNLHRVDHETRGMVNYFPERYLASSSIR
jgi:hypothetical protein